MQTVTTNNNVTELNLELTSDVENLLNYCVNNLTEDTLIDFMVDFSNLMLIHKNVYKTALLKLKQKPEQVITDNVVDDNVVINNHVDIETRFRPSLTLDHIVRKLSKEGLIVSFTRNTGKKLINDVFIELGVVTRDRPCGITRIMLTPFGKTLGCKQCGGGVLHTEESYSKLANHLRNKK